MLSENTTGQMVTNMWFIIVHKYFIHILTNNILESTGCFQLFTDFNV